MMEGRYPEALAAVREMHAWSHRNPPYLEQQSWADRQAVTAALLAEAGHGEAGLALARSRRRPARPQGRHQRAPRAVGGRAAPALLEPRHGCSSSGSPSARAWVPPLEWLRLAGQRVALARSAWAAGRRAAMLTVGRGRLAPSLRFFAAGGIDALPWLLPGLVELAGPGIVGEECQQLLQRTDCDRSAGAPVRAASRR